MSNLFTGAKVIVTAAHNQFKASDEVTYHVGAVNRIQGQYMAQIMLNNKVMGAIPERNLTAK